MTINLQDKQKLLETVEVETDASISAAVIWLHGLGADGHDFVNIIPQLSLPNTCGIRFIFPHAPIRPVTINQGMKMRAWFDITSLAEFKDDTVGILQSCDAVQALINKQLEMGIPASRIFLLGFSQGGAIALHAAIHFPERLGGVLGLSTYLPMANTVPQVDPKSTVHLPIMLTHGDYDDVIPLTIAQMGRDRLIQQGYDVKWKTYPMAHQVCLPEIADIRAWLMTHLN